MLYNPLVPSGQKNTTQPNFRISLRPMLHSHRMRNFLALFLVVLTACSNIIHTPSPSSTVLPTDYPVSAGTVVAFVDAINQQDYTSAFNLLDQTSQAQLLDAGHLQLAYTNARLTAGATQVSYELRGGLLARGAQATTLLAATWQTPPARHFQHVEYTDHDVANRCLARGLDA